MRLLPHALDALKRQRSRTSLAGGLIWVNPDTGQHWTDNKLREGCWKPTLIRAKVWYRYPYQTRHTYASKMSSAGENPAWIASQMGRKDTRMFFTRYARWIKDSDPLAGLRAVAKFSASGQ